VRVSVFVGRPELDLGRRMGDLDRGYVVAELC
jgi:hypothetical protein